MKEETKECTCDNDNRYCKGCYANVTTTMFCHCGEFSLMMEETLSQQEVMEKEKYARENHPLLMFSGK